MPIVQGPHYHIPHVTNNQLHYPSRQPEQLTQIGNLALKRIIRRINPRLHLVQPSSDVDVLIEDRTRGLFVVLFEAAGGPSRGEARRVCKA